MDNFLNETYYFTSNRPICSSRYLWKPLITILSQRVTNSKKVFEIGCGNGATANLLDRLGYDVTGVDTSVSGIEIANRSFPELKLFQGSAYDDLADRYGRFPIVISLEVIEHLFYPRKFVRTFYSLLEDEGVGVISTPYHGYLKNLALALTGKMDAHFSPLWDGGHIKFWSRRTLQALLEETGFKDVRFVRAGRIPVFAKSMIAVFRKNSSPSGSISDL